MNHHRQENDPQRDRSSRVERVAEDMGSENTDLGRQQADGNLGNERTRNRADEDRDSGDDRDL